MGKDLAVVLEFGDACKGCLAVSHHPVQGMRPCLYIWHGVAINGWVYFTVIRLFLSIKMLQEIIIFQLTPLISQFPYATSKYPLPPYGIRMSMYSMYDVKYRIRIRMPDICECIAHADVNFRPVTTTHELCLFLVCTIMIYYVRQGLNRNGFLS